MIINKAISSLQVQLNGGVPSNDSRYSSEFIYDQILAMRGKRLRQKLDQNAFISHENFNIIHCLPLELATLNECECYESDCFLLKSKYKIPNLIGTRIGYYLEVTTLDGIPIEETTIKKINNNYKKTKSKSLKYFFHNNYLYIIGSTNLKVVTLNAIFYDPLELSTLPKCNSNGEATNESCFNPLINEFPIDKELYDDIEILVINKLINLLKIPNDTNNNDNPN